MARAVVLLQFEPVYRAATTFSKGSEKLGIGTGWINAIIKGGMDGDRKQKFHTLFTFTAPISLIPSLIPEEKQ